MTKVLFKNGKLWDGTAFHHTNIYVKDGTVADIGTDIVCDGGQVIDLAGNIVSAGLVDVHTHLRGISADVFGVDVDNTLLPLGVTAAGDASGEKGNADLLDTFGIHSRVFAGVSFRDNHAVLDATQASLERYGKYASGIKVYVDSRVSEMKDTTPLREAIEFAQQHGLRVMLHVSHAPLSMSEIFSCLRAGDIVSHVFHGGEHHIAEDDFISYCEAQARGVIMDASPAGNVHVNFELWRQAIARDAAPNVIGTDITCISAHTRGGFYGLPMCMSIARDMGMSEVAVFRAVTSAAAQALGMEHICGSVAIGRAADLTVLEDSTNGAYDLIDRQGNRVANSHGYHCILTLRNGEIVYHSPHFCLY